MSGVKQFWGKITASTNHILDDVATMFRGNKDDEQEQSQEGFLEQEGVGGNERMPAYIERILQVLNVRNLSEAIEAIKDMSPDNPLVQQLLQFIAIQKEKKRQKIWELEEDKKREEHEGKKQSEYDKFVKAKIHTKSDGNLRSWGETDRNLSPNEAKQLLKELKHEMQDLQQTMSQKDMENYEHVQQQLQNDKSQGHGQGGGRGM